MFPGLDLYHADPAQPLTTAGEELDDLDHHLSVRAVKRFSLTGPLNHFNGGVTQYLLLHPVCIASYYLQAHFIVYLV